jgi:hypothetical protein
MTDFQITFFILSIYWPAFLWMAICIWGPVPPRRYLQCLWVLPIAIPIYVCYLWPFEALGLLKRAGEDVDRVAYNVEHHRWPRCLRRLWLDWDGHALPGAIVVYGHWSDVLRHEREHVEQWYRWGVLFPIVYGIYLLRYGYHDNPFEVEARKAERRR